METLFQKSGRLIRRVSYRYQRNLPGPINWQWRLNGIVGARGTGKTTLLLQQAGRLREAGKNVLYATLDDFYFAEHRLTDVAVSFFQQGGAYLFLDEVHKYPTWARELKNLYDTYPDLKIAFSGSSITELLRQDVDLSRRALFYELPGLSLREFIAFEADVRLPVVSLTDLFENHAELAADVATRLRPLAYLKNYLRYGYYPYFLERDRDYALTLEQVVRLVLEVDLKSLPSFDPGNSRKIAQLLSIVASSAPFKPNVAKLSEKTGISRNTLVAYLDYLQRARLVTLLNVAEKDISVLQKPDKVLLNNPNLAYVLATEGASVGSVRESFFVSQVSPVASLHLHRKADFLLDDRYAVEVGGPSKSSRQIADLPNAYLALDEVEAGVGRKVPLWLFGLLY